MFTSRYGIIAGMLFKMHGTDWEVLLPVIVNLLKGLGILPGAITAFWLRKLYQKHRQRRAIEGWPTTEARIHSGKMYREGGKAWLELTYSYFVEEYRSGTYVRQIRKREGGDKPLHKLRDKRLQVHYDPSSPDRSVILDRDFESMAMLSPEFS